MPATYSDITTPAGAQQHERAEILQLTFQRYKYMLQNWWWIPLLTTAIGLGLQAWMVLSAPPQYQSNGRLMVSGKIALPEGAVYNEEAANFFGTQLELLQSSEVARRADARVMALNPNLEKVPVKLFASILPKTSIFAVSAQGLQPQQTKAYLDAVMDEYIAYRKSMRSDKSDVTLSAITDQVVDLEKNLRKAEDELLNWQKENNVVFLQEEGNSAGTYLAQLNRQLANLNTEYQLLETLSLEQNLERQNRVEAMAKNEPESMNSIMRGFGPAADYLKARQELQLLRAQLVEMGVNLKPRHPKMAELSQRIAMQERLMEIFQGQTKEQFASQMDSLRVQIKNIQASVKEWEVKALDLSRRLGEYERLKSKVERLKGLYEKLLASVQSVDVNRNIDQDVVMVMEYGTPPSVVRPDLGRALLMGGLGGFAVGLGILLLIGKLDDRYISVSELEAHSELDVVGLIPRLKASEMQVLETNDKRHILVESFRNIRSSILFMPAGDYNPKSFLVSSAIPGEGKSTLAMDLAVTMALAGSKTLLVDADLRRGRLNRHFAVQSEPGLAEILKEQSTYEKAVVSTQIPNLSFIPRGKALAAGTEPVPSANFSKLVSQLHDRYDYIIIDSCPVLAADDSSAMAPLVDAVFFVVRARFTSARLFIRSLKLLAVRGVNVRGLIYNCAEMGSSDYPYYQYKEYHRTTTAPTVAKT
ncbi:MAG: polysaccharide biosynthesis tyrosine autokinase [Chthoniobacterales bacterium]|nr:polysaccharide biosynthesis tyrosine autokinase [Chthoniobacterales bacterium]